MFNRTALLSYATRTRLFSTSACSRSNRAIVYSQNGQPADVLRVLNIPSLPAPSPQTVNVRFILSPINPADVNVIEGVYPSKPRPRKFPGVQDDLFVGGNEGLAEVTHVGQGVECLERGDWVVMRPSQIGTWRSCANMHKEQLLKVPRLKGLSEVNAAMMVNPATAHCLLSQFVALESGEWVVQNGANSAVGQAVIQLARNAGLKTINFVRSRDDIDVLKQELEGLGATHVVTYDELVDKKAIKAKVNEWTGGQGIRLGLNCVGGEPTRAMAGLLGHNAHLVTYGGMAKRHLCLPASFLIFKNLISSGFWLSRWYKTNAEGQVKLVEELARTMASGKFKEPKHLIVTVKEAASEKLASSVIKKVFQKITEGNVKKKVLLKVEGTDK